MSKKLHKSQKFLYICLFFIIGVFAASVISSSPQAKAWGYLGYIILFFLIIIFGIIRDFKFSFILFCCLVFGLGVLRLNFSYIEENNYYNQEIDFIAKIVKEPDVRADHTRLTVKPNNFKSNVLVRTNIYPEYKYGDELKISCYIQQPEPVEGFSYDKYLARYNIYAICSRPEIELINQNQGNIILAGIFKIKDYLKLKLENIWMVPVSSFMAGILLGLKKELPEAVAQNFKDTGTIHILVISGLHVLIFSSLLANSLKSLYISRPKKIYFVSAFLIFFIILTGAAPSVIRAGLMAMVILLAEKLGRPKQILNVLVLVAAVMLVINPKILVYDMGFQLSFLATIGLVYLSDKMEKILFFIPKLFGIRSLLAASLSAIILTNPLILIQFQKFSTIAPIANIIIVPFIPIIMMAGLFVLGVGLIWEKLAVILGWGVMILVEFVIEVAKYLASFNFSSIEVSEIGWVWVIGFYFIIFLFIKQLNKKAA